MVFSIFFAAIVRSDCPDPLPSCPIEKAGCYKPKGYYLTADRCICTNSCEQCPLETQGIAISDGDAMTEACTCLAPNGDWNNESDDFNDKQIRCCGDDTIDTGKSRIIPFDSNTLPKDYTPENTKTLYCRSDKKFVTNLDTPAAQISDATLNNLNKITCPAAGFKWTGTKCCSENDDNLTKTKEYYNDPGTIGGCWNSSLVITVGFVNNTGNSTINYKGVFHGCEIDKRNFNPYNDNLLNLVDTQSPTNAKLITNHPYCYIDSDNYYFCSYSEKWMPTNGADRTHLSYMPNQSVYNNEIIAIANIAPFSTISNEYKIILDNYFKNNLQALPLRFLPGSYAAYGLGIGNEIPPPPDILATATAYGYDFDTTYNQYVKKGATPTQDQLIAIAEIIPYAILLDNEKAILDNYFKNNLQALPLRFLPGSYTAYGLGIGNEIPPPPDILATANAYGYDFDTTYNQYIKFSYTYLPAECCGKDQCWGGSSCIDNQKAKPLSPTLIGTSLRCINGNWTNSTLKYTPDGSPGYCPNETQCLVDPMAANENDQCIQSGQFVDDFYCENGNWSSRSKLLALELLKLKGNSDFTLFCDTKLNSLNNIQYLELNEVADAIITKIKTNNFCVLKFGSNIAVATSINKNVSDVQASILKLFKIPSCSNPNVLASDGQYHNCDSAKQLWINNISKTLIYSPLGIDIIPNQQSTLTLINQLLVNPINVIIDSIKLLITTPPSDTSYLASVKKFDRLYMAQQGSKTVRGTIDDKSNIVLQYQGFSTDICNLINQYNQKNKDTFSGVACQKQNNDYYVLAQGSQFSNIYPNLIWTDLTAKLRLK